MISPSRVVTKARKPAIGRKGEKGRFVTLKSGQVIFIPAGRKSKWADVKDRIKGRGRPTRSASIPLHGKTITLSKMGMVSPEELPPPPEGHVRLYHTTGSTANLPEIEEKGLLSSKATGYEAPTGLLWATDQPDAYSRDRALVVIDAPIGDAEQVNVTDFIIRGDILPNRVIATYPMVSYSERAGEEARRWDHLIDTVRKFGSKRVLEIVPKDVGELFREVEGA